ncbi:MAG: metalloregulator ArsR/SmtB family transcription factor [Thermoplasmata archaeon]|nr:metalloregulator ArsR/SmtB family transcription factor [Thermoplasmata archaeon]
MEQNKFWDDYADKWGEMTRYDLFSDFNLEQTLRSLPLPGRRLKILDLGTGAGKVAIQASLLGHTAVGMDSSEEMIKQARLSAKKFSAHIMLVKGDACYTNFPKGMFDVVVAKDLLFCIDNIKEAVLHWKDLLAPGGFLVIIDGNYLFYKKNPLYQNRREQMFRRYGKDDLEMLLGPDIDPSRLEKDAGDNYSNRIRRPSWELWFLPGIGFEDFTINFRDIAECEVFMDRGMIKAPCKYILTACRKSVEEKASDDADRKIPSERVDDRIIAALANKVRLDIVKMLEIEDMSVTQICEQLGLAPNDASYHLRMLRNAGILSSEVKGKNRVYSLVSPKLINTLTNTLYKLENGMK